MARAVRRARRASILVGVASACALAVAAVLFGGAAPVPEIADSADVGDAARIGVAISPGSAPVAEDGAGGGKQHYSIVVGDSVDPGQ